MLKNAIDAHVHVWTPDTSKYPLAAGFKKENMQPPSFTPEELFSHCKPLGVERIVLIQMSFYGFDNSYMLEQMKRFRGVFGGVGVVDWNGPKPDEDMKRLARGGVRGFRVRCADEPAPDWLETEGFERMFRYGADEGLAICPLMNPKGLPSLMRMCAKHPKTRVVVDHLCRIGIDGEIRDADTHSLCALAHYPEVRVKVSAFYALGRKKPPHDDLLGIIRPVYDAYGAERLMWASDCPFAVDREKYDDSMATLRDRATWLTHEDRDWIFRRTAEKIFFG
jgi:predicted TIM-barrel fold metal-dependent hydrolase